MPRTSFILALAIASYCLGAPTIAVADNSHCTSVEAQCALEAGGKCDPQTGHWCYGRSHSGEQCGGSPAAFRACLVRHGEAKDGGSAAPSRALGKCSSIQAQCDIEMGGSCNPRTGHWCYGQFPGRDCGGTNRGGAFDQCVSRKLSQRK